MTSVDHRPPDTPEQRSIPSAPGWIDLVPSGALLLAFGIKALLQPRAVRDVFSGTQAFVVTAAIALGWVLLWFVLRRVIRNGWVRAAILMVVAGFLIYWLVVSALVDKKVVETLPGAPVTSERGDSSSEVPVDEPAMPMQIAMGSLRGIDHDARGTATLYESPDGTFIVGLEQIDIEPGPDYKLYVVPGTNRESPGDDGVFLDSLRGNQGTQFYEVPAGTNIEPGSWTVLVWCRAFAVPIANATIV
jgi:hypothetical protein